MHSKQSGFTLLEVLAAMAIGSMMLIGLTAIIDTAMDDTKGQQAALYQAQIVDAAKKYIDHQYTSLAAAATATTPVVISMAQLQTATAPDAPFLFPGTPPTNVYGQGPCVVVLQPTSGKLAALVMTSGAARIDDKEIANIAANSGVGGGYITQANPTVAQGGTWAMNAANLAKFQDGTCLTGVPANDGGHLASAIFFDGPGQLATDFLYRNAVPGHPELNTMNAALTLNGAVTLKAPLFIKPAAGEPAPIENTGNTHCDVARPTTWTAISADASGALLTCETGIWRKQGNRFWKDPATSHLDLTTNYVTGNTVGDVRIENTQHRAYTWTGTKWSALAVDQNGALTTDTLVLNQVVTPGVPCGANPDGSPIAVGTVGRDSDGRILSCRSAIINGNPVLTWENLSGPKRNQSVNDLYVLLGSSPVAAKPNEFSTFTSSAPKTSPIAYTGTATAGDWSSAEIKTQTPIRPGMDGLLIAQATTVMDRQGGDSALPDDYRGQFEVVAWVVDLDTGAIVGQRSKTRSGRLHNEAVALSSTLVQAIPANGNGYEVHFQVNWTTYTPQNASDFYHQSWYGPDSGRVYDTPLWIYYNIDVNT